MHDLTRIRELPDWPGAQRYRDLVLTISPLLAGDHVEIERRARKIHQADVARARAREVEAAKRERRGRQLEDDIAAQGDTSAGAGWDTASTAGGYVGR